MSTYRYPVTPAIWQLRAERLRGQLAELRGALEAEREHSRRLQAQILELRRDGFQAPPPALPVAASGPELPDGVMAALLERAQPGTALWRQLNAEIAPMLQAGASAEEVAERVLKGMPDPDALLE
jgi:hypothetical protein